MKIFEVKDHEPSLLPDGEWNLVWGDEFDGDKLDDTKWYFRHHLFHKEHKAWIGEEGIEFDGKSNIIFKMVEKDGNDLQGYPYALNEVAVLKHDISSMISIDVEINGEFLTTYQADGLIVNTSTGSTGYALSVGGPIIVPGTKIIGLVPVAPHSLTVRPLTLSADTIVRMKVKSRSHNFLLSVDGRSESATEDTTITIRKAPYTISVLKRSKGSFFSTLRDKLMWGADSRE